MDFFRNIFNKGTNNNKSQKQKQKQQQTQLDIVRMNQNPNNKLFTRVNQSTSQQALLNVISWNIEDFVSINDLYNSENQQSESFLNQLRNQDIILIQEWKNKNYEGDLFLCKLNNNNLRYTYNSVDRVAIIYNTYVFDSTKTVVYQMPLEWEAPSLIERTYTTGRQKYNMLTILYPKNTKLLPICVINFHLSAFSPQYHADFHKRQLSGLLDMSLQQIKKENITNFGMIIGGDTNYRNLGDNSNDLLGSLISINYDFSCRDENGFCGNGLLRDVCEKNCLRQKTQSFACVHEKGIAKKGIKFLRKNVYTGESTSTSSINDNRLDFVATNLKIDYKYTKVLKLCDLSDHSAILSKMSWKIDESSNVNVANPYVSNNSSFSGAGTKHMLRRKNTRKLKKTKRKTRK